MLTTKDLKIYYIGGVVSWSDFQSRPVNACYDIVADKWTMLPKLHIPGVYEKHY